MIARALLLSSLILAPLTAAPEDPIRGIMTRLRRFHEPEPETAVPPEVGRDLTALKHALRDLIIDVAREPGAADVAADVLRSRIVARLEAVDVPVGDEGGFGVIAGITLEQPPAYSDWLVATTKLAIPYGDDVSLYVFERQGVSWQYALAQELNGYDHISGAQGFLDYYVPPPMADGKPYLVTTDFTPNSISVFQTMRLNALRVGRTPEAPVVLAKRAFTYVIEEPAFVSVRRDGFAVINLDFAKDRELAGFRGVHYLAYSVTPSAARLVREMTVDPYNLMERWKKQPWKTAAAIVDPPFSREARGWHERLIRERWACGLGALRLRQEPAGSESLQAVAPCDRWNTRGTVGYVVLQAAGSGFRIMSLSDADPRW